ncbi:ketosteroid isomerase-related protein [Mesobacterium sp. TK19101]|uniref:Ketosteroid isomerase-related protein n=1 Tax=Mesobacterium hydrothermale TaxID=3111907 RepID=A0ABU6HHW2_9RHOB|nr:ketosteroid isomerase-related protein [Mesobacterium sp. TK19101]MEC3862052.1 ketosteroid isomerase-related protein [Mesobacterium sp. TK19101]
MSRDTIQRYFEAFNSKHIDGMLECLTSDVEHHVNEGQIRVGRVKFADFCAHMDHCYDEELTDMVIFVNEDGTRGAAEYIVNGIYKATDAGLPEATGQTYRLPAGSFFSLKDGKISRVVTYYNLADWIRQVS